MKSNSVWRVGKYTIKNGKVFNKEKEIQKTVKGYTIGFWLNGRFRSLSWINSNCEKIEINKCPF